MFGWKRSKREVIRDNAAKGKQWEDQVKFNHEMRGEKVERTGYGHDFKVTKTDPWTGKRTAEYIEAKTGNAKLSKLQKKKKKQMGSRYKVERDSDGFGGDLFGGSGDLFGGSDMFSKKPKRSRRKKNDPFGW